MVPARIPGTEVKARLLCYLVVNQLIARERTGEWLSAEHLIESARIWVSGNAPSCDWPERLEMVSAAMELTSHARDLPFYADEASMAALFLARSLFLEEGNPVVKNVYHLCAEYLSGKG